MIIPILNSSGRSDNTTTAKDSKAIKTMILSGDRKAITSSVAKQLSIDSVKAEFDPTEKFEVIENLKSEGKGVLMVGDGLNDAPALRNANVSMSPSTAIDISQNSADIVFQDNGLNSVFYAFKTEATNQNYEGSAQ